MTEASGTTTQRFDPDSVRELVARGRRLDDATGRIQLEYALDDLTFVEVIELGGAVPALAPERRRALERALDVLLVLAGTSYYKAAFPPVMRVEGVVVTQRLADLAAAVYRDGLAEAAWTNELTGPANVRLTPTGTHVADAVGSARRSLVPIGGGKDSVVALEEVRQDGDVVLFSTGTSAPVERCVRVAGLPHRSIVRRIDPRLIELNAHGARNGHIPITAITSTLAVIVALLEDCDEVVMANERSASVGSFDWQGISVNHQWSKGWDFEAALRDLVHVEIATDLDYFSLLRPWSELAIARAFSRHTAYHQAFTSCNRVFRLRDASLTWCGECDKCRFVFLALAPWMEPAAVTAIIGRNLLDDPAHIEDYRALLGIDAVKPFECVGEIEESAVAMRLLATQPQWLSARVVATLAGELPPLDDAAVARVLAPSSPHAIPDRHARVRDALG
jgi:hypothetical protein